MIFPGEQAPSPWEIKTHEALINQHVSHEKKIMVPSFPFNPGWLIGILFMILFFYPHITGLYKSTIYNEQQDFF